MGQVLVCDFLTTQQEQKEKKVKTSPEVSKEDPFDKPIICTKLIVPPDEKKLLLLLPYIKVSWIKYFTRM